MKFLSRVVWSEGMHLSPQHFQMQSRYFEDSLWFLSGSLRNHPWGLLGFALDADAVRNGRATLRYASGIFPDGLVFEVPDSDPVPDPISLSDLFTPTDSELILHLAVPGRSAQGLDTDLANSTNSRYGTVEHLLRDETITTEEYPVTLGRKNLVLCSAAQLPPNATSFPVARIMRDGKGGFIADETFLPPLLRIAVVEDLLRRVKRLSIAIEDKIAVTRRGQKRSGQFEAGTSALDVANYWFLHALCSVSPALNHQLVNRNGHPEELYAILAEMAGSLCTFSLDSTPDTIPPYDHLNLNFTFAALEDHIIRHLEIVVPSNTVTLDFRPAEQYVHVASVTDERCFRRARWILGVRSNIGDSAVLRMVPNLVKCCSAEGVVKLVQRALPGLELTHLPIPPSALASQADMHYFSIDTRGPCWEHTLVTKQFGVYLPGDLGNAVFEVTVIVEATA
jgi:type VI secretion system protein ImpJ